MIILKKIDFEELKKQLEDLEKEVARLKQENPNDDYAELDKTIEDFRKMISEKNIKKINKQYRQKRLVSLFLNYLFHIVVVLSVLGFCVGFINQDVVKHIGFILPAIAFIIFLYRKLSSNLIFNGPLKNHKIVYTIALYFVFAAILGIVDFYLFNIWTSIWNSILTLVIIGFVLDLGEFLYYRKMIRKHRKEK